MKGNSKSDITKEDPSIKGGLIASSKETSIPKDPTNDTISDFNYSSNKHALAGKESKEGKMENNHYKQQGHNSTELLQEFAEEAMLEKRAILQSDIDESLDKKLKFMKIEGIVLGRALRSSKQFAEEAQEEGRTSLYNPDKHLDMKVQSTKTEAITHNIMPEVSTNMAQMMASTELETRTQTQAMPGAMSIMGTGGLLMLHQFTSDIDVNESSIPETTESILQQMEEQNIHYTTATLVVNDERNSADPPILANATKIDTEAIEKANRRRLVIAALISFVLAIATGGIAFAIYASTRLKSQPVGFTSIPIVTKVPQEAPTLNPSMSLSSALFPFLVANSFDGGDALSTAGSPQQQASTWIEGKNAESLLNNDTKLLQLYSLVTLYYATSGTEWNQFTSTGFSSQWLVEINYCNWGGLECDDGGRILTSLDLNGMGLSGALPAELGYLSSLAILNLGVNALNGHLPSDIGRLTSLTDFQVDNNSFTGPLPSEIGQLTGLEILYAAFNSFLGVIPTEIGKLTNLKEFIVHINHFNGILFTEIGLLSSLEFLSISDNDFSGTLPTEISQLTHLNIFDIAENQFTGTFSLEIGMFRALSYLNLSGNQLKGNVPPEIGNLVSLTEFYLHNNLFTGTLPTEIGNMTSLERVAIYVNQFTGDLPTEMAHLVRLTSLSIQSNKFTGTFPPEIGNLGELMYLELSNNQLNGKLPTDIGNLVSLIDLSLENNYFSGTLPTEIGNLIELTYLSLSNNQLNGKVPTEIGNLVSLTELYIDNNYFSGTLPTEIEQLNNLMIYTPI